MTTIPPEVFRRQAAEWLRANREHAPPDYGAICPPNLIEAGIAWQQRLFEADLAGIDWPVVHGGQGLTPAHQAAWIEECARAAVPPVLNMVGLVLAGQSIMRFGTAQQQAQHLRPHWKAHVCGASCSASRAPVVISLG